MRWKEIITEGREDDLGLGTVVSGKKGADFEEVTHYFLRNDLGWRYLLNHGYQGGVIAFAPTDQNIASLDDYHDISLVYQAPQPGARISNPIQILGFPENTLFISPGGKPVHRVEDGIEYEGERFDLSAVSTMTRLAESLEERAPHTKKGEKFVTKHKAEFKKRYGDKWKQVLYATAWKLFGE